MAKWTVTPGTVNNSMKGSIEYDRHGSIDDSTWQIYQDEKPFLEQAKMDRETQKEVNGFKKFATIPDVVAIEILTKYGIDIHDPNTMSDSDKMKKFKKIIQQDYKYLLAF